MRTICSSLLMALVLTSCATVPRPTDPEYKGAVPIGDNDYVVDVDYCDGSWIMSLTRQLSVIKGPGEHSSLYGMVNNVAEAIVVSEADTVFVASSRAGILRSINQGITFATMPGLDTVGKVRSLGKHANELVAIRVDGTVLRTERRRTWRFVEGVDSVSNVYRIGKWLLLHTMNGRLIAVDEQWALVDTLDKAFPNVQHPSVSADDTQIMAVANKMLYRVTIPRGTLRLDSVPLPADREWRGVSVLGSDVVLLAGRNEVWWGSFEEPLQIRSAVSGNTERRIVSMDLSEIGLVVGFRGTEQSVFLNIKNSNDWEPLLRATGLPVTDVIWTSRSGSDVFVGIRDGAMYRVATARRALLDIASPFNEMNILMVHGSYPNKLVTMYDGRILRLDSCTAEPTLIQTPIPFASGVRVMDASANTWFIHDAVKGLFRSTDEGSNWQNLPIPDTLGYPEVFYGSRNEMYLYASRALWYSSNDGKSWSSVLPKDDTAYAIRRLNDELVSVSFKGWKRIKSGKVVDIITPPVRLEDHRVFVFDIGGDVIAILTESALYVSNDRGVRWGSIAMSRESMFSYVRVSNDRVFAPLIGTGLMMFDVYSDRPDAAP